jgi:hypothetical protein
MTTIRVRNIKERCPLCEATAGAPCVESTKWKLWGQRVPLKFPSTWCSIVEYAPQRSATP